VIVSCSYRTDVPAFHAEWFARRLAAGHADVASPYGGRPYRVRLDAEAVDGFVFWTRNVRPLLAVLAGVRRRGTPFVVQYTVTGYPAALEAAVPPPAHAVALIRGLAAEYGPRTAVWRYDPVLLTDLTGAAWHRDNLARLADALAGATDEVVVSLAAIYAKTRRNLDRAAARHGFAWHEAGAEEADRLLADMAAIAGARGIRLTVCSQPERAQPGAACIDAGRLADVAGRPVAARRKGNRPGCLCHESRDIGAYDTCPHGCAYCYAVSDPDRAAERVRAQDRDSAFLGPAPKPR
jgi:hypothetical protein